MALHRPRMQNAFVESFNSRLRDEHLNAWHFDSLLEARVLIEDFRVDYNKNRPHSSLGMLTPDERQVAQTLLAYPEHTVGRMMTLDFVAVRPEWTVGEALTYIREHGYDRETLNMIYVVDAEGRLIDDVRVRRFLLSPLDRPVSELLDGNYTMLSPTDDREKALGLWPTMSARSISSTCSVRCSRR